MIYFPSIAYAQRKTATCKLGLHPTRLGKGRHLNLSMRSHGYCQIQRWKVKKATASKIESSIDN